MTASVVVVVSDVIRAGKPLLGLAVDSIGRYGHGGLLRERFIPRLLAAKPEDYINQTGDNIDPQRAWQILMRNEKPGGHGDRAGAVGVLEAALWDLAAKMADKPLWQLLTEYFSNDKSVKEVAVYASGGHYRKINDIQGLQEDLRRCQGQGYTRFKIKIGGVPLAEDLRRIEAALDVIGDAKNLALDGNGSFSLDHALKYCAALQDYQLAWFEEPVEPLDYALHKELVSYYSGTIATGENLFSSMDVLNLLRYGGLRPEQDYLQMDISLSYGITDYLRMLAIADDFGWSRQRFWPHAGHIFALHVIAGLGLGGYETTIDENLPIAGFPVGCTVQEGYIRPPDTVGVGFEQHAAMYRLFDPLLD